MTDSTNVPTAADSGNTPSADSSHHEARTLSHLWSDLLRARNAVDQCEDAQRDAKVDLPEFDDLVQAVNDVTDEIMARDPENLYDCATQIRTILAGFETDGVHKNHATPTLKRVEHLLCKLGSAPCGYETAAARLCAGFWLLREYADVLAPTSVTVTAAEWNNHKMRLGWLVDRMAEDVDAVGIAMWGPDHDRLALSDDEGQS